MIRAIKNHIIFRFDEEVDSKGLFKKTTDWGLEIHGHPDDSSKSARWVTAINTGPDCERVKIGDKMLVKPLRWSVRFKYEGEQYWRTDETQLVAVDTITTDKDGTATHNFAALNDSVVFMRTDERKTKTDSGIEVVGKIHDNTAFGVAVEIGPKVLEELKGAKIYFLDQNFFNYFEYRGKRFAYLEEKEVLAYEPKE